MGRHADYTKGMCVTHPSPAPGKWGVRDAVGGVAAARKRGSHPQRSAREGAPLARSLHSYLVRDGLDPHRRAARGCTSRQDRRRPGGGRGGQHEGGLRGGEGRGREGRREAERSCVSSSARAPLFAHTLFRGRPHIVPRHTPLSFISARGRGAHTSPPSTHTRISCPGRVPTKRARAQPHTGSEKQKTHRRSPIFSPRTPHPIPTHDERPLRRCARRPPGGADDQDRRDASPGQVRKGNANTHLAAKSKSAPAPSRPLLTHPRRICPSSTSLRMYNSLVERCFRDCVDTFRRKDLEPAEEKVWEKRERERGLRMDGMEGWSPLARPHPLTTHSLSHTTVRPKVLRKVHEALLAGGRPLRGTVEPGEE